MEMERKDRGTEIDLGDLASALLHNWWIILIAAVVFAIGGFTISKFMMTPQYKSTTSVYMLSTSNASNGVTYTDTQLGLQIMKDYKEFITSRTVLEKTIKASGYDMTAAQLKSKISFSNPDGTRVISISVTDPDPVKAEKLANTLREVSGESVTNVLALEAVRTIDEASRPEAPSSPSVKRWTAFGALLGFALAVIVLAIIFLADTTVKTTEDVEKYLGLSTLAVIPLNNEEAEAKKKKKLFSIKKA